MKKYTVLTVQQNQYNKDQEFTTMQDVVDAFKVELTGLYAHNGGYVQIWEGEVNEQGMPLIEWREGCSGGYVSGQAVVDYHPEEDLDKCECETCAAHDDDSQELCEACEVKCRELCLYYLVRDYK